MKAVITVLGKDNVGILSEVSRVCAEASVNITDVTQSIMQNLFAMIMMVDCANSSVPFNVLSEKLKKIGDQMGLEIHIMNEEIFNSMHRV